MKLFSTVLGLVLAAIAGTGLSIFVLIGSQGMDNRTPILPVIAAYVPMLAVAHGVGAAAALIPVALTKGCRAWMFAAVGFAAGGALEGLLFPISILTSAGSRSLAIAGYVLSLLLPALGGIAGLILESKTGDPRGSECSA